MISKTRMIEQVKTWRAGEIVAGLQENPVLMEWRDDRGRNWLHLTASIDGQKRGLDPKDSIKTAKVLLKAGYDINAPAFTEGTWQATPLWYAVGRGRNIALARYLLAQGSTPEHCLWAASSDGDGEMIKLLVKSGASLEAIAEGETPLLGAAKMSRFAKVELLLKLGANPDFKDEKSMTALHYMLKKGSDFEHFPVFTKYGASFDIKGPDGQAAREIMSRKKDERFRNLAENMA